MSNKILSKQKFISEQQILKKKTPREEEIYVRATNLERKTPREEEIYVWASNLENKTPREDEIDVWAKS